MTGWFAHKGQRDPPVPVNEPPGMPRTTPDPEPSPPEERDPSPGEPAQREPPENQRRQRKFALIEAARAACR